ncbi:MAG: 50S ribosomal protein L3 [Nanoarchaeota archaeon]
MVAPSTRKRGSKQYWPRVRAKKPHAVVNSWDSKIMPKETNFLGFPGYKVGMTNIGLIDNFSHTKTKGTLVNTPVTIIECPVVKVLSVRFFGLDEYGNIQVLKEITGNLKDKHLSKRLDISKKKTSEKHDVDKLIEFAHESEVLDVRLKIVTTPSHTTIGKKKPEVLEMGISGNIDEKIKFAFEKLGSEVKISDVFKGGELVDSHGITRGKGFQGAVKRFGVKLTSHKSEKSRRHAGNVGAWTPSRVLTTIPLPGQHGYHERTEWNKWILKVSSNPEEINNLKGFRGYGIVKGDYILIKGSVQGPVKRLITFVRTIRPNKRYPKIAPEITYINK